MTNHLAYSYELVLPAIERSGNDYTNAGLIFAIGTVIIGVWCRVTNGDAKFTVEKVGKGWSARPSIPDGSHDSLAGQQTRQEKRDWKQIKAMIGPLDPNAE